MQRSKRASVESQVNLQPLLLAAGAAGMMSRPSADSGSTTRSKRDSAFSEIVSSFPISSSNLRRISLKRSAQMDSSDSETMSPVYRLYPHQAANGNRRLRAMEDRPDLATAHTTTAAARVHQSFDTAIYNPSTPPLQQQPRHLANVQPADDDDVFELEAPYSATDDFVENFTLPPSRSESRDSFATPLSSNSRIATPEVIQDPPRSRTPGIRDHSTQGRRSPSVEDFRSHSPEPSFSTRHSTRDVSVESQRTREHSRHRSLRKQPSQQSVREQHILQDAWEHQSTREQLNRQSIPEQRSIREQPSRQSIPEQRSIREQPSRKSIREQQTSRRSTHEQQVIREQPSRQSIRNFSSQGRYTPQEPPPSRGRLQTYVPKGFDTTGRASVASSRHSTMLHKVSSSGQIADIDDTPGSPETMTNRMYGVGDRSSAESVFSQETTATSLNTLPPLQSKGPDNGDAHTLEPLLEDDPRSFDLVDPPTADEPTGLYALEERANLMLSDRHLQGIFDDSKLLMKFTSFLNVHRPQSIPLLIYYLDALKAIRAIRYANAIAEALDPIKDQDFTKTSPSLTNNISLERKANEAFKVLTEEDLPAYISYVWIQVVSTSIQRRITGTLAPHLREASEGLAETFCLSDPSRKDNPIVFASEEFARTTQYGMTYAIGRNCRFLQGPQTNRNSVRRIAMACAAGKECNEVFVNYRRDGSPFLNLLMCAPLMDSKGEVRYFIGAQVDVSGLLKGCNELPALARLVDGERDGMLKSDEDRDEFQELTEMFNSAELDTVRKYGGRMHKEYVDDSDRESLADRRPRMVLKDNSQELMDNDVERYRESSVPAAIKEKINGKLDGVYQHYLLVRPAPSLRILFTSPSLRVPGILQSPFLHRIGGSTRVRNDLAAALAEGRGVTAKIRWLLKADEDGDGEGRPRWIHCTPLFGHSGSVGVWMIVLVEEEGYISDSNARARRFRQAPPVASVIGGKDWDTERSKDRSKRPTTSYTVDLENPSRTGSTGTDKSTMRAISANPARNNDDSAPVSDSDSAIVTAPSPDVPRGNRRGISTVDFETQPKKRGIFGIGSRNSSHASSHLVHQMNDRRSSSKASAHSTGNEFSLDLR